MKRETLVAISRQVAREFPEMSGVRPTVQEQWAPRSGHKRYLLKYKNIVRLPGGGEMKRVVRVTADEDGQVLRMSTSR